MLRLGCTRGPTAARHFVEQGLEQCSESKALISHRRLPEPRGTGRSVGGVSRPAVVFVSGRRTRG